MKRLYLIPLIAFLTACVSSPTPTAPAPKIETATAAPATNIPTNTPISTNTVALTPTRDLSIPESYIKDASGNYTKTENGLLIVWDAERNSGYSLMFDDYLFDQPHENESAELTNGNKIIDTLQLRVYIDPAIENWSKLSITHKENMDPINAANWTRFFKSLLMEEMAKKGLIKDPLDFSYNTWYSTGYTKTYDIKEGDKIIHHKLHLGDGSVTTTHITANFEALFADKENNNYTLVDGANLGAPNIKFMVKIESDANGNTFLEIAPSITDALVWSDKRIIEMLLFGFCSPLTAVDNPYIPRSSSLGATLAMNHDAFPYFVITRQK